MSLGEVAQDGPDGEVGAWSQEASGPAAEGKDPSVDAAFRLQVEEGSTVSATFPFFGDLEGAQLSFQIGDHITVLQKDELWSWGKLERTGEEGWFPHNYVQASFQPLPGMHELKQRMLIKKAREEAIARGEDPDLAEAMTLNGGAPAAAAVEQPAQPQPEPQPKTGLEGGGLGISAEGWDWGSIGMGLAPATASMPEPQQQPQGGEMNNGMAWGNHTGEDSDMFGMWMEDIGEEQDSEFDDAESVTSATSSDRERRRRERKNIARELLDTEDKYVRMLEALLATIIRPCLGQGSNKTCPLGKDEAEELFGSLRAEEILAINTAFREQLRARMASLSDETCFGDLFNRFAPFLKMYVEYCTQHENTASRVSLIAAKNDRFGNLLHRARSDPRCQDHDAQSLLIMPIQRIPRYKLLLEGMLKNTEQDHPDRPLLQSAIEQISDVASFINDSIKRRENQAKIWDLQAMLTEPIDLATPTRIFIRSGVLTKLGRSYQDRDDFFALFNDGLLHAKPATFSNKYIFKRIDPVLQVENVGHLTDKPKALYVFRVVTKGHIYLLSAKSAALKNDWMKVLDLCIRGGKRETIHKGALRVIRIGKEIGVRVEYFYVFNDVVVRGKALWRGKFKHKETMVVTRLDSPYELDGRVEAMLPKDITSHMVKQLTFRILHRNGSLIVIAKSETDKVEWLSALEHQMKLTKTPNIGTVASSNRIVHEDNFANLEDPTGASSKLSESTETSGRAPKKTPATSGDSESKSEDQHRPSEHERRTAAASTFGVGPVEGQGGGAGDGDRRSGARSSPASRTSGRSRERSSPSRKTPLATTSSDQLISLESSDEEVNGKPRAPIVRQSMPQLQQQRPESRETVRRRTVEGHVSPPKRGGNGAISSSGGGSGGGGLTNGSAAGPSLLEKDLMAVFGTSSSFAPPPRQQQQRQQQQQQPTHGDPFASFRNGGSNVSGGAMAIRANPGAVPPSSTSVPLLRPPAGDTPSYSRSTYGNTNGGAGGHGHTATPQQQQQPHVMVPYMGGGGGREGTHGFGPGAIVPHAGDRGMTPTAFQPPRGYGGMQQPQGFEVPQQAYAGMSAQSQQQPQFAGSVQGRGIPNHIHQQQSHQFAPQGNSQFAQPQQQQYQQQQYQQPQQQQFAPQQQQQPQYHQQPMPQQFQGF